MQNGANVRLLMTKNKESYVPLARIIPPQYGHAVQSSAAENAAALQFRRSYSYETISIKYVPQIHKS